MKLSLRKIIEAITLEPYEIHDEKGKIDREKSRKIAKYAILTQH